MPKLKTTWIKLKKWIAMAVLGMGVVGGAVGGAPLSERDMAWKAFEMYAFNTPTGELGMDEYAISDTGDGYYIRLNENEPGIKAVGIDDRPIPNDLFDRKLVQIQGKACYNKFTGKETIYERIPCDEYYKHATIRNNPQPVKTERVSLLEAVAAVTYDNATGDQDTTGVTSSSFSHTTSGSDRYLIVAAGQDDSGNDTTTCTYNSVSMTPLAEMESAVVAGSQYLAVFGLVAPATGSNTVACSWSTSNESIIWAYSATGVDQTTPVDAAVTSGGTRAAPVSDNIGSVVSGDLVFDSMNINGTDALTEGGSQTNRGDLVNGSSGQRHAISEQAGSGTVTMSWSGFGSQRTAHVVINMNQVGSGGGGSVNLEFVPPW